MNADALFEVMLEGAQRIIGGEGISQASSPNGETFVFRNAGLEIVGVLQVLKSGEFVIAVRSDSRRQGIATALLDAGQPDFSMSTYSRDGQKLIDAYRKNRGIPASNHPEFVRQQAPY